MPETKPAEAPVTLDDMIEEARRELDHRHRSWPRLASAHRMAPEVAARRLRVMDEIVSTLVRLRASKSAPTP